MNNVIQPPPGLLGHLFNKLRQYRCLSCSKLFVTRGPKLFASCPACGKRELEDTGTIILR